MAALSLSAALLLPCGQAAAQKGGGHRKPSAAMPPTPPTALVEAAPAASAVSTPLTPAQLTPAQRPARRAEVTFAHGQLAVTADNSSLNQILREIGRTTGIKITGGVADERVFGKYGPLPAADLLAALLEGTGSNLLLLQTDAVSPGELILTPRHGGPTPPNPNAPGFDDDGPSDDAPAPPQVQQPIFQPGPAVPPAANVGVPAAPAGIQPSVTAPATDATDPNAIKTPQQIYEQLQRLRQQQQPPQ